jgi:4-aminobutyrate aminotransferase-like enzyme/Ser/Thr protein kinase RdoA (MazF antagonist)
MERDAFETAPPDVSPRQAEEIVGSMFGLAGEATPLDGERDRNFRIAGPGGAYVLKISNRAESPDAVRAQVLCLEHVRVVDPALPVPELRRTAAGEPYGVVAVDGKPHLVHLVTFVEGTPATSGTESPAARRAVGAAVARLDRALRGFTHPALDRALVWHVARLPELRPLLEHVAPDRRAPVERVVTRFEAEVGPALRLLAAQTIHGDVSPANILLAPDDPERVAAIVDFGDLVHGARVLDPAIAAAYQSFGLDDPLEGMIEVVTAYNALWPLDRDEVALVPDLALARLAQSLLVSSWRAGLHPENAAYILSDAEGSWRTLAALDGADPRETAERVLRACALHRPAPRPLPESLELRRARLGPALSLTYDDPVRLVSGDGVWLTEADGSRVLDAYNNVPQVGHCHPRVTAALAAQAHRLATNTRYLVDEVHEYADRLAALLPGELSVVMFVNSGSEANDLACQIARVVTGRQGVVITEHAYHGTTAATAALSPEELGRERIGGWVATIGGASTLAALDAAERVRAELADAFAALGGAGHGPGMLIADSVFSSDGIFAVPPGYLHAAYETARAAGALCVADEVQAGFGRIGEPFWGFAQDGVVPDVVTLGKPMGNGHPMGAVVTTPAIAQAFAEGWHFFSTFAGSPVAAAAGAAVLDVLEDERLPARAETVGAYLRARLRNLAAAHPAIVDVRGPGLFVGVELRDASGAPAGELARSVTNGMRRRGVLVGRTGPALNVLKIRPPLVFADHHADQLVTALDDTLRAESRDAA